MRQIVPLTLQLQLTTTPMDSHSILPLMFLMLLLLMKLTQQMQQSMLQSMLQQYWDTESLTALTRQLT